MATIWKTPVSILHEYMQKHNLTPKYDLLDDSQGIGTNSPTFHYQVTAGNIRAIGIARSKKEAKHAAAKNALENLARTGVYIPNYHHSPQETPSSSSPVLEQVNYVGCLQELCTEKGIPQPDIKLIADVGLPHDRRFTMECRVANLTERATETTKKKAKQSSAQKMLHRLMDSLPEEMELQTEQSNTMDLVPMETIIQIYNENSILAKRKVNWGMKICDFPNSVKNLMKEEEITAEELFKDIHDRSYESLQELLKKLKVQTAVEYHKNSLDTNKKSIVAVLRIKMYPELVYVGISPTEQISLAKVVQDAFSSIEILAK